MQRLETIDAAIELGLIPKREDGHEYDVLLIAPYRSQLEELRRQLTNLSPRHVKVEIESVDAVQGREASEQEQAETAGRGVTTEGPPERLRACAYSSPAVPVTSAA